MSAADEAPHPSLSVADGITMLVGIVVGIGIFKTPQMVAANVASEAGFLLAWLAGGAATLIGALVYAELGSAYPSRGGEYDFLSRAFGRRARRPRRSRVARRVSRWCSSSSPTAAGTRPPTSPPSSATCVMRWRGFW